jgi:hypothetical protein
MMSIERLKGRKNGDEQGKQVLASRVAFGVSDDSMNPLTVYGPLYPTIK